jgi:hypothetical protein
MAPEIAERAPVCREPRIAVNTALQAAARALDAVELESSEMATCADVHFEKLCQGDWTPDKGGC